MQVFANFKMPVKFTKRRKWIVASCPILDVHSQGKTLDEAKKNLSEALLLFFVSCLERNMLDRVLKDCGLFVDSKMVSEPPPKKRSVVEREDYIDVPIPFLVAAPHHRECHA